MNKVADGDFNTLQGKHNAGNPFTDVTFKADESSLIWRDAGEDWKKTVWVDYWERVSTNFDTTKLTLFGANGVNPKDIRQGKVGNCWLMSAASALAEKGHRIENMFHDSDKNEVRASGLYGVNIYALGVPKTIIVDDYLPLTDSNPILPLKTVFAGVG